MTFFYPLSILTHKPQTVVIPLHNCPPLLTIKKIRYSRDIGLKKILHSGNHLIPWRVPTVPTMKISKRESVLWFSLFWLSLWLFSLLWLYLLWLVFFNGFLCCGCLCCGGLCCGPLCHVTNRKIDYMVNIKKSPFLIFLN